MVNIGTEEAVKSSPSLTVHETAESHAARKDLPTMAQTLVRPVPHKRMLHRVLFSFYTSFVPPHIPVHYQHASL